MRKRPKSVALVATCPHCGEAVQIEVTKKEIKAIYKGFQGATPSQAELIAEKAMKK